MNRPPARSRTSLHTLRLGIEIHSPPPQGETDRHTDLRQLSPEDASEGPVEITGIAEKAMGCWAKRLGNDPRKTSRMLSWCARGFQKGQRG